MKKSARKYVRRFSVNIHRWYLLTVKQKYHRSIEPALALDERGLHEMLKQQFLNMKKTFEKDEYEEFMRRFQVEHNKRNNIAPGKESIFSKFSKFNKGGNKIKSSEKF